MGGRTVSRTTKGIKRILIQPLDKVVPQTTTTIIVAKNEVIVAIKEVEEMPIILSLNVSCVVSLNTFFLTVTTSLTSAFKHQALPTTINHNLS